MKSNGTTKERVKLGKVPSSLAYNDKEWLYYLPSKVITSWSIINNNFLEKYFLATRATLI